MQEDSRFQLEDDDDVPFPVADDELEGALEGGEQEAAGQARPGREGGRALVASISGAFSRIYAEEDWGVRARSGYGSREDTTREFRAWMELFLRSFAVESVVDAGCGHWPT